MRPSIRHPARPSRFSKTINRLYFNLQLRRFMNKPVSWVRIRDEHILTVDQTTFIGDQRFESIYRPDKDFAWSMQIKYVQRQDEGWYECQVSTEPKISTRVFLKVVGEYHYNSYMERQEGNQPWFDNNL